VSLLDIGLVFGMLECPQDFTAQPGGVVDVLQPGRTGSTVIMAKIGVTGAGRDD